MREDGRNANFGIYPGRIADNSYKVGKNPLNPGVNRVDLILGLLYWANCVKFLLFLIKKGQNFFDN
jgi:hypothetical protein